jgi:hypothetical protein
MRCSDCHATAEIATRLLKTTETPCNGFLELDKLIPQHITMGRLCYGIDSWLLMTIVGFTSDIKDATGYYLTRINL